MVPTGRAIDRSLGTPLMCCANNVLLLSGFSACVAVLVVSVLLRQSTRWVTECREREAESESQHTCVLVSCCVGSNTD